MDPFANGGQAKWLSVADLKTNILGISKNDYADSKALSAATSTTVKTINFTPGLWIITYWADLAINTTTLFNLSISGNPTGTKTVREAPGSVGNGTATTVRWKITALRLIN